MSRVSILLVLKIPHISKACSTFFTYFCKLSSSYMNMCFKTISLYYKISITSVIFTFTDISLEGKVNGSKTNKRYLLLQYELDGLDASLDSCRITA